MVLTSNAIFNKGVVRHVFFIALLLASITLSLAPHVHGQESVSSSQIADAAGLFNERGYFRANSFSRDGEEIINDYNGNLIWTRQLRYLPVTPNGIHGQLSLTYNGSVGHVINPIAACINFKFPNVNYPEWIISLNNIAIQTFNFENEAFTWSTTDTTAQDDDVAALITGYHTCFSFTPSGESGSPHGTVNILMGDGSVKQFMSLGTTPSSIGSFFLVSGEYRTFSKDDQTRGYIDPANGNFTMFHSGGTRTLFKPYRPIWETTTTDGPDFADSLMMYLPIQFLDQMGNAITVAYDSLTAAGVKIPGRPLVRETVGYTFDWNGLKSGLTSLGLELKTPDSAIEYTIEYVNLLVSPVGCFDEKNRATVTQITDKKGRVTSFQSAICQRRGVGCGNCFIDIPSGQRRSAGIFILLPQRIYKISYPDGGLVSYSYYEDLTTRWVNPVLTVTDTISVKFNDDCYNLDEYPCKKSAKFNTPGRDPYFVNMIVAKRRLLSGNVISRDSLKFTWQDVEPFGSISADDLFITDRWSAKDAFTYPAIINPIKHHLFTYKQYPERGPFSRNYRDRGWSLKQLKMEVYDAADEVTLRVSKTWDVASCDTTCSGTFLLKSKSILKDNITTIESYSYQFSGDSTLPATNNIIRTIVKDAWGDSTFTYFKSSNFTISSASSFYENLLIDSSVVKHNTQKIQKEASVYYGTSDPHGYIGQIKQRKNFFFTNGSITDSVVKSYQYITGTPLKLTDRGALRAVFSAKGDSVIYHYHEVISNPPTYTNILGADSAENPVVYKELRNNGVEYKPLGETFKDTGPSWYKKELFTNGPARQITDTTYKVIGPNDVDTVIALRTIPATIDYFQFVDEEGKVSKSISPNGYISQMTYENIDRIDRIILPGNFEASNPVADSVYTMRFDYDDVLNDGDSTDVTTRVRSVYGQFTPKSRVRFDGFSRIVQRDAISSDNSFDSTRTDYDPFDRVSKSSDQLEFATTIKYDNLDRAKEANYPDNTGAQPYTVTTQYSSTTASAIGLDTLFTMGHSGLYVSTITNENGDQTKTYTDVRGRIRLSINFLNASQLKTYFGYDDLNNLILTIKPEGDTVRYFYNSIGWLTKEWSNDYDTIFYVHDKVGNVILRRDGNLTALGAGNVKYWEYRRYDGINRIREQGLVEVTGTDTTSRIPMHRFFYDQTTSDNSFGRLSLTFSHTNGHTYGEKYNYDARGRLNKQVNTFNATLDSSLVGSRYLYSLSGTSYTIEYTYNYSDQVTAIKYPNADKVVYEYDERGRLFKVGDSNYTHRYSVLTYSPRNELDMMIYFRTPFAYAQTLNFSYNPRGWLEAINDINSMGTDKFGERIYYYDDAIANSQQQFNGNIVGQVLAYGGDPLARYRYFYDDLDRLIRVRKHTTDTNFTDKQLFTYDDNGNRLTYATSTGALPANYAYRSSTNLLDSVYGLSMTTIKYTNDPVGNMKTDSSKKATFYYNLQNELYQSDIRNATAGLPSNVVKFDYNNFGERVYKSFKIYWQELCGGGGEEMLMGPSGEGIDSLYFDELTLIDSGQGESLGAGPGGPGGLCTYNMTSETRYIVSKGKILAEYSPSSGDPRYQYIYAGDQRIAMRNSQNKLRFYLNDHLGSARVVVDSASGILDKFRYTAFGAADSGNSTSTGQPQRYTGKTWDDDGGINLYYYGARYYDPQLGRFTQIDPLAAATPGISGFIYADDNPINGKDVGGLYSIRETKITFSNRLELIGRKIYQPDWVTRGNVAVKGAIGLVPWIGPLLMGLSEGQSGNIPTKEVAEFGLDVIGDVYKVKWLKSISKVNLLTSAALLVGEVYYCPECDDPAVIDAYQELYWNAPPCWDPTCVVLRVQEAKKRAEEKKKQEQAKKKKEGEEEGEGDDEDDEEPIKLENDKKSWDTEFGPENP